MEKFHNVTQGWYNLSSLQEKSFRCGYCGEQVCSDKGYRIGGNTDGSGNILAQLMICPSCKGPVFFTQGGVQIPSPAFGNPVSNVPTSLNALYEEARICTKNNCFTASVMVCRKIIMNIAVEQGAKEGVSFAEYVNFLADKGFIPPNGKGWVDHIRAKGNEANHEIKIMVADDAQTLISFIEMLLRFIYEFPSLIPKPSSPSR